MCTPMVDKSNIRGENLKKNMKSTLIRVALKSHDAVTEISSVSKRCGHKRASVDFAECVCFETAMRPMYSRM